MEQNKPGGIAFRPWNILVVIVLLGIAVGITKYGVAVPELPARYFHAGGIIAAVLGTMYFLRNLIRHLRSYRWSATRATITASHIHKIDDSDGVQYQPHISYTYTVGATEYASNRIQPSGDWSSSFPSIAHKQVNRYPEGTTVHAYYNPARPEESYLERTGLLPILAGLITFVISVIAFSLALAGIIRL